MVYGNSSLNFKQVLPRLQRWADVRRGLHNLRWHVQSARNRFWREQHLTRGVPDEPYVFFPMHHQPEASTCSESPAWVYQDMIIEQLAIHAPGEFKVVVKEHPRSYGRRGEKFFGRLAKKYSACPSRSSDGDLGWVHRPEDSPEMGIKTVEKSDFMEFLPQYEKSLTKELVEAIMSCEKHKIPEPIETQAGFHIILICETRFHKAKIEEKKGRDLMDDVHKNAFHAKPKVWEEKFGPN